MDTNAMLISIQDKLPKDLTDLDELKNKLDRLDDKSREETYRKILTLNLKNPRIVFWVGSFVFGNIGVGRFMIGDIWLGIARLMLFIVFQIVARVVDETPTDPMFLVVIALLLSIFIWWIVDLFIVGKKVRKQNLSKILEIL